MNAGQGFDADVVVVGAGLAGLSIVGWLDRLHRQQNRQSRMPSIRILDPRTGYANDRTWCFWESSPHPFAAGVDHRWGQWRVGHGGESVTIVGDGPAYVRLPASNFYAIALECVDRNADITLDQGVSVNAILAEKHAVRVETSQGALHARTVIDGRPPCGLPDAPAEGFWQMFVGEEIVTDRPLFDPTTATLMDFHKTGNGIEFLYVLPISTTQALVEVTAFRPERDPAGLAEALQAWMTTHAGSQPRCLRREQGALPMMPMRPGSMPGPGDVRVALAGIAAGWMRPASGYMFSACQRGSAALAGQILAAHDSGSWRLSTPRVRPRGLDVMDRIFLRAMRTRPDLAPQWFLRLFSRTSKAQQARFLGDLPGLGDQFAVMRALPPAPFLRALFG